MKNQREVSPQILLTFASFATSLYDRRTQEIKLKQLSKETLIVGGEIAPQAFAPWQVSLQNQYGNHFCGGAIIDDQYVVTAASCVAGLQKNNLKVVTSTNIWDGEAWQYEVEDVIFHCNFDKPLYHNDIALIKLTTLIAYDEKTQNITIAELDELKEGENLTMTGWGSWSVGQDYPVELKKLEVTYISNENCRRLYGLNRNDIDEGHLCVQPPSGTGACHGDTGGPLVNEEGVLVGVGNFGVPCDKQFNVRKVINNKNLEATGSIKAIESKMSVSFTTAISLINLFAYGHTRMISNPEPLELKKSLTESRIIGGVAVSEGSAPYQVSIQNTFGEHVCGGSIIAPQWILTAGHCLEWPKQYLKIITGTVNWTQPEAEYLVDEIKLHCLHNRPIYHNDIALVHLTKPIAYNKRTQPIKLAKRNYLKDNDKLILTGWGSIKPWGHYSDTLQKVELNYLNHKQCAAHVRNSAWLGKGHICTDTRPGKGSCIGDSGGPLVDASYTQVGVVNFGEPCAVGYPDAFASVPFYYTWIKATMAGLNVC
uniref:Lectizyme n=1 Tax=Glossina brevipalpis TaxID=37001 RepID=A0A1A9X3Z5_9MUSC